MGLKKDIMPTRRVIVPAPARILSFTLEGNFPVEKRVYKALELDWVFLLF